MGVATGTGIAVASGVGLTLYGLYGAFWWYEGEKCEKPKYSVKQVLLHSSQRFRLRNFDEIEVREYAPYVIAETSVEAATMNKALSSGFRRVAGYIFGDNVKKGASQEQNEKVAMTAPVRTEMAGTAQASNAGSGAATRTSEKIAMTAPVQTTMQDGQSGKADSYKVSFVMPSKYDVDTLPVPNNSELQLREVPAHQAIVHTSFGGTPSRQRVASIAEQLQSKAKEASLQTDGDVKLYQYHPPFAPNILRRVEVLYNLKAS